MMHSIVGPECVLSKADFQESLYAIKDWYKVWSCHVTKGGFMARCRVEICLSYSIYTCYTIHIFIQVLSPRLQLFFQIKIWPR